MKGYRMLEKEWMRWLGYRQVGTTSFGVAGRYDERLGCEIVVIHMILTDGRYGM
jgi:hypothetical protein